MFYFDGAKVQQIFELTKEFILNYVNNMLKNIRWFQKPPLKYKRRTLLLQSQKPAKSNEPTREGTPGHDRCRPY